MLLPETLKLHNKKKFSFHYLYFLPWKDQMVSSLELAGGKVTCIPASNNVALLLQARKVASYIRTHKIRLVHAHLPWAGVVARIAGKITGVPVIYTEHNKQERYHIATRLLNLATLNWLNALVAVSRDVEESIRKHKPKLKVPLRVILNGVNTTHFAPGYIDGTDVRARLGIPSDAPVIGTIAVFRFQKRLDVWLSVAKSIIGQIPQARFIIVGDGPLKAQLHEKARSLELDGIVHFAGLQTEVRPFLASLDLYMMSSVFEGLPIALLEAMSSGCPVISTRAGGVGEVITDGSDGYLCPVDEPERLADLAIAVLNDSEKQMTLSAKARQTIIEFFSMEKMVTELEALYSDFLTTVN